MNKQNSKTRYRTLVILVGMLLLGLFLFWADRTWDGYKIRILNLCGIYVGVALGQNLITGFAGQFSLGIAGFMAIGAYTTALLTMPPATKAMVFFMEPLISPLNSLQWGFLPSLGVAALLSSVFGLLIGIPAFRFTGDYLAIVTLGFAEIIRVILTNTRSITNAALGLKAIPAYTNVFWSWLFAVACIYVMTKLVNSSYGRAWKAIRDDELAAQCMGVSLMYHKCLALMLSAMMAGLGGGLLANLITTIDPNMFRFPLTFTVLMMVVLGGMGSVTGTVLSASLVTIALEVFRSLEEAKVLFGISVPGIPGMRMLIFSGALMLVVLFFRRGLMGDREITWEQLAGVGRLLWARMSSRKSEVTQRW